jgi:hypothetical protein
LPTRRRLLAIGRWRRDRRKGWKIVANQPSPHHRGRIDRFRKCPSVPLSTNSPTDPCASGPRFRSRTISAGCGLAPTKNRAAAPDTSIRR